MPYVFHPTVPRERGASAAGRFAVPPKEASDRILELQLRGSPANICPISRGRDPRRRDMQNVIPEFMGDDRAKRKGTDVRRRIKRSRLGGYEFLTKAKKGEPRNETSSRRSCFRVTTSAE